MFCLTEADIMSSWLEDEPVRVSVCCITYKQEQYIKQAIDSFLMQKTTFPFEIIIGEDCGGDGTLEILDEYKNRYPNLIKVITSEKNVGANENLLRVFDATKGKYIAICEGDDYWIDELKIQKQYDCLQSSPSANICFTAAKSLDQNGTLTNISKYNKNFFNLSDVVRGGGGFMVTATIFFRVKIVDLIPEWFSKAPIGDFYLQVIASIAGGALYLNGFMAVYRLNAESSWTKLSQKRTTQKIIDDLNLCVENTRSLIKLGVSEMDVKYAVARHESQAARTFLLRGDSIEFYSSIVRSANEYKWINSVQMIQFYSRGFPFFIRFLFSIRLRLGNFLKR